jgi:DNA primase
MARISDETIKQILDATDMVDLVSEKVALAKKGRSYFGLCPFHQEDTPSFSVEPNLKLFNCFGCGEKGNAITWLQKTERLTYLQSIQTLANRAGIDININTQADDGALKFKQINQSALDFFRLLLKNTVQGKSALDYLEKRFINHEIVEKFELGLSPNEKDLLYRTMIDQGVLAKDLTTLGLASPSEKENGFYDIFRNRIIFPIHDEFGSVVGFSGRIFNSQSTQNKYMNSPQTPLFKKSQILYNLHRALPSINREKKVILVEGFLDVISLSSADVEHVVCTMGTALTNEHVRKIKSITNEVVLCFDGDQAGVDAALKSGKLLKQARLDVSYVLFPDSTDPDEYRNSHGNESLRSMINHAIREFDFWYQTERSKHKNASSRERQQFLDQVLKHLKKENPILKTEYLSVLAKEFGLPEVTIRQELLTSKYNETPTISIDDVIKQPIEAERKAILYFIESKKYLSQYINRLSEVFYIEENNDEIKSIIIEIYHDFSDHDFHSQNIEELLIERLPNALLNHFQKYIKNVFHGYTSEKDFSQLIITLHNYKLKKRKDELYEQLLEESNIEEKIKIKQRIDELEKEKLTYG